MHYELPPRNFWWWLCGGLQTYDALIVMGYLIVNVLYVEQRYTLYLAGLLRALMPRNASFRPLSFPWNCILLSGSGACHAADLRKHHGELSGWNYGQTMFST